MVGAGPGMVDLTAVRRQRFSSETNVVIYTGSLVSRELLDWVRQDARTYDGAIMDLEQVLEVMERVERGGLITVYLHAGDPCLYGTIREQMDDLDVRGIGYDTCSGVSSLRGVTIAFGVEYTLPDIGQSVVIARMVGGTPVSDRESTGKFAVHGSTMVIFLSAGMTGKLSEELMKGGYPGGTPTVIVYKAIWPGEEVVRRTVAILKGAADREGVHKTTLTVVGNIMVQTGYERSKSYDSAFTIGFRVDREDARGKHKPGTFYVVGVGSGEEKQMTGQILKVMEQCQVIVGYMVYVELIRGLFPHKEFLIIAMTREEEWYRKAFDYYMERKDAAAIYSGDAEVYGMAGLILELAEQYLSVSVRAVSGITAVYVGATALGVPLMHDFVVINLNNQFTPLGVIWNRVEAMARTDLVICLYNPANKGRPNYFRQACSCIPKHRPGHTVCGLAANIGREGERMEVLALGGLKEHRVDMFTVVYIGNSHTRQTDPYMVTSRGYRCEGN